MIDPRLEACPNQEWRCIVVLGRYCGLRIPSELVGLEWADVLWNQDKLVIRSPKQSRHHGGLRYVPLFHDVRRELESAHELARTGQRWVITRYRNAGKNLRTQFERIVTRAGVQMWRKPFANLRSSCSTDFFARYPAFMAAYWLGHSPTTAAKHYTQILESDYRSAVDSAGTGGYITGQGGTLGAAMKPGKQDLRHSHLL